MSTNDQTSTARAQERDRLIEQFKDRYGSFESERYLQDERNYKVRLAEHVHDTLDKQQLERLIASDSFTEAARLIRRTYQRAENNLLNSWDRLPLEDAPDEELTRTLYALLYGTETFAERFAAWVALLSRKAPNCWPSATFFLMLADPQQHIFVKPIPFRTLLVRLRPDLPWTTRPTAGAYEQLQQLSQELYEQLRPLGARDMIDVQSFVWSVQPENQRAWIFQSNPRYYDLPGALAALDQFQWSARQRASDMHVGDTVYLWESGENAGILAVATITGEPDITTDGLDVSFYRDNTQVKTDERRVPLRIDRVLARRLTRAELLQHPQLSKLQIIQQPNSTNYKVSETDAVALESLVATIPDAPKRQFRWPPRPLDGPVFVVSYARNNEWQQYGETLAFTTYAIGNRPELVGALNDFRQGGPPVYLIIYRPQPQYAFSAWARVRDWSEQPSGRDGDPNDVRWTLSLDQHEFPQPLGLKSNARSLMERVSWLKQGLPMAFQGYAVRQITAQDGQIILDAARQRPERYLPPAWEYLGPVRDFVQSLDRRSYDSAELHAVAGELAAEFTPEEFAERLRWLRVLAPAADGYYQPRDYTEGNPDALLRLMIIGLLLPDTDRGLSFDLPARSIVPLLGGQAHPVDTFAPAFVNDRDILRQWYHEAGFIEVDATSWRGTTNALSDLSGNDAAVTAYNQLLGALRAAIAGNEPDDLIHADGPIPSVIDLDGALRELASEILIDPAIVRRVYRSLAAGRHVVLSGPPGTGKTELAMRLPKLLWREPLQTFTRLTSNPNQPPTVAATEQRHGYATALVTATEDWGVRDVVGGIGPQLDENRRLGYTIQHGALTRTVLQHYADTQRGESLPSQGYTRRDYIEGDKRYRGVWLVIDEFTRAPVDAAFGSLLTTLSGGDHATLAVPTAAGAIREVPIPPDFRIIGTLNSFDRHFLNQISEALKRRFDFIDVLPPVPALAAQEQGIAAARALRRLRENGFKQIEATDNSAAYRWPGIVSAAPDQNGAYALSVEDSEAETALTSLWRIFRVLRYFRQFGTAQLVALLTNLFVGRLIRMPWSEALDTAFADSLADQLQVLTRDEQQLIVHFLTLAGDSALFTGKLQDMLKTGRTNGRRAAILRALRDTEIAHFGMSTIEPESEQALSDSQIVALFDPATPLALPPNGIFLARVRNLIGERGL